MIHPQRDAASITDFACAGREAGEKAAADFRRLHPLLSSRDPACWLEQLGNALASACQQMIASGANDEQLDAWRAAFDAAMRPAVVDWDCWRNRSFTIGG